MANGNARSVTGILKQLAIGEKLAIDECIHTFGINQTSLITSIGDNILAWSCKDSCFYAQHLSQKDAIVQTLCVTRPPIWTVNKIAVNSTGTAVLLIGLRGVGVVDLPQQWGKFHTFDGGKESITCRIEYITERFLMCSKQTNVVAACWHPGSPNQNFVVMLTTDHYLRVYNLRSRDMPEQALLINVPRPDSIFSPYHPNNLKKNQTNNSAVIKKPSGFGAVALGEIPVDFTIAAPYCPDSAKDQDFGDFVAGGHSVTSRAEDLLWPVFVLYANGDVYHTCLTLHAHKLRSRVVTGPLVLRPPRHDNYALEWCSVAWLGKWSGVGGVLVLGTCAGRLHHCVVMPPEPPAGEGNEEVQTDDCRIDQTTLWKKMSTLKMGPALPEPTVSLFVYESVDLELSFCSPEDNMEQPHRQPLQLMRDHHCPNRYFVLHNNGVHAVTVPLVDSLEQMAFLDDTGLGSLCESDCRVEFLLSTQSVASAEPVPVAGAALWVPEGRYAAVSTHLSYKVELLMLLSSGMIVSLHLPPHLPSVAAPDLEALIVRDKKLTKQLSSETFFSVVSRVLQRETSQPVLVGADNLNLEPLEALRLTTKTLHTLRTEYLAPQAEARHLILRRLEVLCEQQRLFCKQLEDIQLLRQQLYDQKQRLLETYELVSKKQALINNRLDDVVSKALRQMPTLSAGERWMMKQLHGIQEQMPHLKNDLQQLHTKLHWHTDNLENDDKVEEELNAAEDVKLSQNHFNCLKRTLNSESEKIESLVSKFNNIKKNFAI